VASRALDPSADACLLLASDGLFETLSDDDIEAVAREALAAGARPAGSAALAEEVARRLVRAAIERGSRDNVSAQCVLLGAAAR
jgi:serine/threonine protein phosphatase PrpC